jgi:hypothetical protein
VHGHARQHGQHHDGHRVGGAGVARAVRSLRELCRRQGHRRAWPAHVHRPPHRCHAALLVLRHDQAQRGQRDTADGGGGQEAVRH